MQYVLRYSRPLLPFLSSHLRITTKVTVIGHSLDREQDKLVLFMPDGGVREVPGWRHCAVELRSDWALAQKARLEAETGQSIPLNITAGGSK